MFVMALIMKCRNYHKHSWNPFIENVHMGVAWSRLLIVCYCFFLRCRETSSVGSDGDLLEEEVAKSTVCSLT